MVYEKSLNKQNTKLFSNKELNLNSQCDLRTYYLECL